MTSDHHALITQLCDELDHNRRCLLDDRRVTHPLADRARAVLARWGHQPVPAAEGEVAELVTALRADAECAEAEHYDLCNMTADQMRRAADLLEQRHLAPVPVAERLPRPEDCDAEGRCWLLTVEDEYPQWRLHSIEGNQPGGSTMIWVPVDSSPGVMVDAFYASHWLPATALPLPAFWDGDCDKTSTPVNR